MTGESSNSAPPAQQTATWLTAAEAADYLRMPTRKALYQAVRRGRVPVYRLGRSVRFNRVNLDRLLMGQAGPSARG